MDQVGAAAGDVVDRHGLDHAFVCDCNAHVDNVSACMNISQKRFAAISAELDRAFQHHADGGSCHFVRINVQLDAEAAAKVGADNAHLVFAETELACVNGALNVRYLAGLVQGQLSRGGLKIGDHAARLKRHARLSANFEAPFDDVVSCFEHLVDLTGVDVESPGRIGFKPGVHQHIVIRSLAQTARGRQYFIIDCHQLRGVFSDSARFGDHGGHRFSFPFRHVLDHCRLWHDLHRAQV